jgi:hypothetical protein
MESDYYKVGSIFQIDPDKVPELGGQFVVASEIKDWGVQGYLLLDRADSGNLTRYKGLAYVRRKWDELAFIGTVEWFNGDQAE